jgi:sporulation protein YlmC with PRC-barrel domain
MVRRIIGVGGFLGIGEKDVAVTFNAVEFASGNAGRSSRASGSGAGANTTAGSIAPAGTPDRIVIRMTLDQLQNAPQFARLGTNATASGNTGANARARGNFVQRQQPDQFLASRMVGTAVYGANNERVGDVNDVLMDRDGRAQALIIGVGSFLGIGEKDVAVTFNAVEFASGNAGRSSTASGSGTGANTTAGSIATAGTPDRIVIRATRDQLNAAPQFARLDGNTSSSGSR